MFQNGNFSEKSFTYRFFFKTIEKGYVVCYIKQGKNIERNDKNEAN